MSAKEVLQNIGESLGSTATVKSVFGEPVHIEGKTVVPVAKVAYGFGAGFGLTAARHRPDNGGQEEGGGGGGGVAALPVGALEITATQTRFVPFWDMRLLVGAFAAGTLFGRLFWSRRHKS
jgi:uncharacterized spore protein YtfJ